MCNQGYHAVFQSNLIYLFILLKDAQCGNGMKFRNMSCVVFDGSREDSGKVVDDEFCADLEPAVNGDKQIVLQASCAVPCPGTVAPQTIFMSSTEI